MTDEARLSRLLERLVTAEVDFVLVGALAVNAWGYIRGTRDIDIVPNPEHSNLDRLIAALGEVRGRVRVGDDLLGPESVRVIVQAGDRAHVVTELGDVDVLQGLPQIPGYGELDEEAEQAELGGLQVRVCSLEHLVAMKRASDRPLDRIDLEALKTAHPEAFEGG